MPRDLLAEYAALTRELVELTRRRNEVGEMIASAQKSSAAAKYASEEKETVKALQAIGSGRSTLQAEALRLGVPDWRLDQLLFNLLLRVRKAFPEYADVLPRRIGPRTLAKWKKWEPAIKKYQSTL